MRILLLLIIILASCSPCRKVAKHPECFPADSIIIERVKIVNDTTYLVDYDEIGFEAWLMCDSNNQVLLRESQQSSGVINSLKLENNRLKLRASTKIPVRIRTEYQTRDSIIKMVNPVDVMLKDENTDLNAKVKRLQLQRLILSIISLLLLAGSIILVKLR